MGRPKSIDARCVKGCEKVISIKPEGMFTCADVAKWCDVSRKYGYQIVAHGISRGYFENVKRENEQTYYSLRGNSKKWLIRSWSNGIVECNEHLPSSELVRVRPIEHREKTNVRSDAAAAINRSKLIASCLSKTPEQRSEFSWLWNSTSTKT